jgi:mannose-6-phosphate isomerase
MEALFMIDLYPFLLEPRFDRRPWGARDLSPIYELHVKAEEEPIGEAWLTSEQCRVENGPLAGTELGELCRRHGREFVGTASPDAESFPLLIKFLFPREKLSVQVHPDDETAQRQGQPCGKTECWYVVHSEAGAQIGLGLRNGITRDELRCSIQEGRAEKMLNWIDVQPGEMYYVDAGTVHALGGGSIILETQQNSDTTYRLYDYGRGRELHIQQGMSAVKERTGAGRVLPRTGKESRLIETPYFVVERFALGNQRDFPGDRHSVQILVAADGSGVIEWEGKQKVSISRGRTVVVPAATDGYRVTPNPELELVRAYVPAPSGLEER